VRRLIPLLSSTVLSWLVLGSSAANAAVPNRITRPVDPGRTRVVGGSLHRLADPQFDQGAADPAMPMDYMILVFKPSAAQQAELDSLLADQQNPSSPLFRQWLTPEEFGNRFGLSASDHSKAVAWLTSQGFTVNQSGRARNWVAFSGTAGQVSRSLQTPIHRFRVNGEMHFANTTEPSVPEALSDVAGGFLGLNDFQPQSFARLVPPDFNSGTSHFLVPEDFATIYNVAPLYKGGIDGTGQSIAIVGTSDVSLTDIRAFRTRYNLPANDPKMLPFGTDPGFNGAQAEGNLDLEWSGAIAPNATIYFVISTSFLNSILAAVDLNVAPVMSVSYGFCEIDYAPSYYRSIGQQANAQGITWLNASGDSGAASCDSQSSAPLAAHGKAVSFPAVMPEVTGVGGTQFVEGTGTYWATTNSPNFGSALSYIPEAAWNESGTTGLGSTGGGASVFYSQPAWQNGPGVPNDGVRHVPDIALSAAGHDAYEINYLGGNVGIAGTSASTPSMAGIIALLNQYQVSKGFQKQPGLGNINPQLYRLAQSAPSVFHDITAGDNIVNCMQSSPDCQTGSFGYKAGAGYDMTTGLGSVDANALVTQFNTQTNGVTVNLVVGAAKTTPNDTVAITAIVAPAGGSGTPTGTVSFSSSGTPLGSAPLTLRAGQLAADQFFPAYLLGTGTFLLTAEYSGDAAFSSGGATALIQVTIPTATATIIPSWPDTVWPSSPPDAQGLSWQTTLTLREVSGVPAMITSFTIDGQAQPLAQYFPSPNIAPNSTVSVTIVFRNLVTPVTRTFAFTGIDVTGQSWSRQFSVNYNSMFPGENFNLTATPLIVIQNTAADPSCQWAVQLNIDDFGGYLNLVSGLTVGNVSMVSQVPSIFGTTRVDAYGSLQGTLCFGGITPPSSDVISVALSAGISKEVAISFAGPPANPVKITASPATINLAAGTSQTTQATLSVGISDKTQAWTASIFPTNRTTTWLTASQYSGTGPGQIVLTANGSGFAPGVYRATVVIQSANAMPQYINVPVMFVLGGSTSGTAITGIANPATYQPIASPGMILSVFGANLASTTQTLSASPLSYSPIAGVTATINGSAAPLLYISPAQINLQIPYAVGAGPAVVGINNNGQIAGFQFQVSPSAPGIFVDANGTLASTPAAKQGGLATLYLTGAGEVSPALKTAFAASTTGSPASLPKPVLPLTVTVGGVPAFLQFVGLAPGQFGVTQVNFYVPASVSTGVQPVVVTVGSAASKAANMTVQPQ